MATTVIQRMVRSAVERVAEYEGLFEEWKQENDLLSTENEQLRNEVRTLSEQPATYAEDNAKLCEQLVEVTDNYLAAQKRVNELLQERMTLTGENQRFNQQIDNLQSQVDTLTIQLETQKVLTPEPVPAKRTRSKRVPA